MLRRGRRRSSRLLKWGGALVVLVIALGFIGQLVTVAVVEPTARELVIERLDERFDHVRLDELELEHGSGWSLLPSLTAVGRGLAVSLPNRDEAPPFISMGRFTVELDVLGLLREPIRIRRLRLDSLEIQIPPRRQVSASSAPEATPPAFIIEKLEADGTVLRILPEDASNEPLQFDLHQLRVASAGLGEPMNFDAVLDNAKPPGRVRTTGAFGPLALGDVGSSPVAGSYVFERAKLEDFGGIGGTLYSEGEFGGVLARLEVEGFTDTPDFQLSSAGHPIALRTDFRATVDGTNGDTFLEPVDALLGESTIATQGGVFNRVGTDGKTVCLDASGSQGRIEDYLHLAMDAEKPLMTGGIRFQSLILIPPGDDAVIEKLVLDGEFLIESAEFPEVKIQNKVDGLSEAGRGVTKSTDAVDALRNERVLSNMRGEFELHSGVMTLTALSFAVPGARVSLEGSYGLTSQEIDFRGELRLDAKLSETTEGLKSFLLKLVDPLFEKKDAGAVIPIKITGTPDAPSFGPDLGRVLSREEITASTSDDVPPRFRKTIDTCENVLTSGR